MLYIRKTSSEDTLYYDLNGRIDSISYEDESRGRSGFFNRLFG